MSQNYFQSGPSIFTDEVVVNTGNGHGAVDNKIRIFTTLQTNTGTAITRATSANNGDTFTINTRGIYLITYCDAYTSGNASLGISINSNELTTSVASITAATRYAFTSSGGTNLFGTCVVGVLLSAGDVVRAHTDGSPDYTNALVFLRIKRIG